MDKDNLLKMIEDDADWILKVTKKAQPITADTRLIESFNEINEFISSEWREPESWKWIHEHKLSTRLKEIKINPEKIEQLKQYDIHNTLPVSSNSPSSIDDILADDDMWILDDTSDIFNLKFVKKIDRSATDYVARRKPCSNFDDYKELFIKCHEEISSWKRELSIFQSEESIQPWMFYVLDWVLLYIKSIWNVHIDKNHKKDWRLHCIFENGTESTMLLRSLWKAMRMNKWWRVVSEPVDESMKIFQNITKEDNLSGYIYVAEYKWENPEILWISNLYKVWFSTIPVLDRVKNSEKEPTYLMAPVHITMEVECYNMNPQKFENAIHKLLWSYQINLDIFDEKGKRHTPREWFLAPFETIEQAIDILVS